MTIPPASSTDHGGMRIGGDFLYLQCRLIAEGRSPKGAIIYLAVIWWKKMGGKHIRTQERELIRMHSYSFPGAGKCDICHGRRDCLEYIELPLRCTKDATIQTSQLWDAVFGVLLGASLLTCWERMDGRIVSRNFRIKLGHGKPE